MSLPMVEGGHQVRRAQNVRRIDEAEGQLVRIVAIEELDAWKTTIEEAVGIGVVDLEPADPQEIESARLACGIGCPNSGVSYPSMKDSNHASIRKWMVVIPT